MTPEQYEVILERHMHRQTRREYVFTLVYALAATLLCLWLLIKLSDAEEALAKCNAVVDTVAFVEYPGED